MSELSLEALELCYAIEKLPVSEQADLTLKMSAALHRKIAESHTAEPNPDPCKACGGSGEQCDGMQLTDYGMEQANVECCDACLGSGRQHVADEFAERIAIATVSTIQSRVHSWMKTCFGEQTGTRPGDKAERAHRFLEEALELVQSCGCSQEEALMLVDYVYGRPVGEMAQEAGGTMTTLAALCNIHGLDMIDVAETELARNWQNIESIRAKQAGKPKHSPLPQQEA